MVISEEEYNKMLREFWTVKKIVEYVENKIRDQARETENS